MLTPERTAAALETAADLERAVKAQIAVEQEPKRQGKALAVYRHAHALRIALEGWQDQL